MRKSRKEKKAIERGKRAEEKERKKATDKGKRVTKIHKHRAVKLHSSGLSLQPPPKRRCRQDIDTNECSVCFGRYEQDIVKGIGTEWISCACGWWLHVDCADTRVVDVNGCERFCPICIM